MPTRSNPDICTVGQSGEFRRMRLSFWTRAGLAGVTGMSAVLAMGAPAVPPIASAAAIPAVVAAAPTVDLPALRLRLEARAGLALMVAGQEALGHNWARPAPAATEPNGMPRTAVAPAVVVLATRLSVALVVPVAYMVAAAALPAAPLMWAAQAAPASSSSSIHRQHPFQSRVLRRSRLPGRSQRQSPRS